MSVTSARGARRRRPAVEPLEGRALLATLTVNTDADTDARDDVLTLREAIRLAQGDLSLEAITSAEGARIEGNLVNPGLDTIAFNIPGASHVIAVQSALPTLREPIVIDGLTQPGSGIGIDGFAAGADANGLVIAGGGSTVRGIVFLNFRSDQLVLRDLGGNRVVGNTFLYSHEFGSYPVDLGRGIGVIDSPNNTIGGASIADRNLIIMSGHEGIAILGTGSVGNLVQNNQIGVFPGGIEPGPNFGGGVLVAQGADGNTIGGVNVGEGNVIVANNLFGVRLDSSAAIGTFRGNAVLGNVLYNNALGLTGGDHQLEVGTARVTPSPSIDSVVTTDFETTIKGTLRGAAPGQSFRVEVFSFPSTLVGAPTVIIGPDGVGRFTVTAAAHLVGANATATPLSAAGNTSAFSPTVLTTLAPVDLGVSVSAAPQPVASFGQVNYTYLVPNLSSGTASGVKLDITLPLDVTLLYDFKGAPVTITPQREFYDGSTGTPQLVRIPATISVQFGDIGPGATATFTVPVRVGAVGDLRLLTTQAIVTQTTSDPNLANNSVLYTPQAASAAKVTGIARAALKVPGSALLVSFSADLAALPASARRNYTIVAAGRDRKLGTRDDRPVPIASVRRFGLRGVIVIARAKLNPAQNYRLGLTNLTDSSGKPIDSASTRVDFGRAAIAGK